MNTRFKLAIWFVFLASTYLAAQSITNVLNPASDLAGRHLVTAEGSYSITGTMSWTVPMRTAPGISSAPGIVSTSDQTTGWSLTSGAIGGSISGTQRFLLNSAGLSLFGTTIVNGSGVLQISPCMWTILGKTANYSPNLCELVELTSGSSITITLPLASTCTAAQPMIGFKNDTTNIVTIARSGSDTIDGGTSFSTTGTQYESFDFVCNAAKNGWMVR